MVAAFLLAPAQLDGYDAVDVSVDLNRTPATMPTHTVLRGSLA